MHCLTASRARGEYLRTHFKNMREVAAALSGRFSTMCLDCCSLNPLIGMSLTKAYAYLGDVKDHKRVIPFRRFAGGVGRASQAKEFKATQGMLYRTCPSDLSTSAIQAAGPRNLSNLSLVCSRMPSQMPTPRISILTICTSKTLSLSRPL
jgi:hypothetical protein